MNDLGRLYIFPKIEYRLCESPEVWRDVTHDIQESTFTAQCWYDDERQPNVIPKVREGYRLRKVPICTGEGSQHAPTKQWAFIVEKKVNP